MSQQQIMVVLGADIGNFNSAMGQVQSAMHQTADTVRGAMDGVESNVNSGTGGIKSALKGMAGIMAGAFAIDKIKDFGISMIEASGEAQALSAQFEQVFGDISKDAQKTIDGLGKQFGMVPSRIQPAMTQMTSMFKGLGLDTTEAMETAERAVTLVADASAFYDKSFEDANSALNSFIKGNYEGGEAIGLFANETQMASWASKELGVDWKNLDEAGKQVARLKFAEAMQKASGATGQASREADGLQNVLGNLKQSWTDFTAVLGQPLLELAIPIMQSMASALGKVTTKVQAFYDSIKTEEGIIDGFKQKLSSISFDDLMNKLGTVIPQMIEKGKEMILSLLQGMSENAPKIAETIVGLIQGYIENLATFYPMLIEAGVNILLALVQGIVSNLPTLIDSILTVMQSILDMIVELLPLFIEGAILLIQGLAEGIIQALPMLIETMVQLVLTLIDAIVENLPMIINAGVSLLNALIDGIISILPALIPVAIEAVMTLLDGILDNLPVIIDAGIELLLALIDGIIGMLPQLIGMALTLILALATALITHLPEIISAGIKILLALIDGLIDAIPQLVAAIPKIVSAIFNAFAEVDWGEIGKNIIDGIASGISNFAGNLIKKGKEVASNALSGIKDFLGIHSPSRVFRDEVGKWIPAGIAVGIEKDSDLATKAVDKMGESLVLTGSNTRLNEWTNPISLDTGIGAVPVATQPISNYFTIQATVREEADIDRIAKAIVKEQKKQDRAGGRY